MEAGSPDDDEQEGFVMDFKELSNPFDFNMWGAYGLNIKFIIIELGGVYSTSFCVYPSDKVIMLSKARSLSEAQKQCEQKEKEHNQ